MKHAFLVVCLIATLAAVQFWRSDNREKRMSLLSCNVEALAQSEESGGACCQFSPGSVCYYVDDSGRSFCLTDYIEVPEC